VTVDVLPARRRQGQRAREGAVRAGGVADLEIVAAQIVPGAGILLLLVLEDGFYEDPVRLRELAIALVGFFGGGLEVQHPAVDLEVGCADLAGWLWRGPPPRGEGRGETGAKGRESGPHVLYERRRTGLDRRRPARGSGNLALIFTRKDHG